MGKKMEGDENQRRAAAREAREHGKLPSGEGVTMGASKQRKHLAHRVDDHVTRVLAPREHKQPLAEGKRKVSPHPRQGHGD